MAEELYLQIEAAIIENQPDVLEALLKQVDDNACLNLLIDSALSLAVRLSRGSMVEMLLCYPGCNPNHQSEHNYDTYCPLDMAFVMAFDNQKEPRQSACWNILEILLEAGAEPAHAMAMSYVVRSAFKRKDDPFILRLIHALTHFSTSYDLHCLLLKELYDHQYIYSGIHYNDFLEQSARFTIKLMKHYGKEVLEIVFNCFGYYYYSNSFRDSFSRKNALMTKLLIYATVCGWKCQSSEDFVWISIFNPHLSEWCRKMSTLTVHSLTHLSRLSIKSSRTARQHFRSQTLPKVVENYIRFCDIDAFFSSSQNVKFDCLQL